MEGASNAAVSEELPHGLGAGLSPAARNTARLCLSIIGVLGTGSLVGVASSLYIINHYPLLLIAISPIGRHLILVAPIVDPFAFIAVATARRLAFYLPCFHLGRSVGPPGLLWLEGRAAHAARFIRWLERLFNRAPHAAVFLLPGPALSSIAGISGMRAGIFAAIVTLGLLLRMLLVVGFGELLREPIEALLALIEEYRLPGTLLLLAGVVFYQRRQRRSRRQLQASLLEEATP